MSTIYLVRLSTLGASGWSALQVDKAFSSYEKALDYVNERCKKDKLFHERYGILPLLLH